HHILTRPPLDPGDRSLRHVQRPRHSQVRKGDHHEDRPDRPLTREAGREERERALRGHDPVQPRRRDGPHDHPSHHPPAPLDHATTQRHEIRTLPRPEPLFHIVEHTANDRESNDRKLPESNNRQRRKSPPPTAAPQRRPPAGTARPSTAESKRPPERPPTSGPERPPTAGPVRPSVGSKDRTRPCPRAASCTDRATPAARRRIARHNICFRGESRRRAADADP